MPVKYAGAEWLRQRGKTLSPFGELVADILGQVFLGLYHIERPALRVDWRDEVFIKINLDGPLATHDFNQLTALVVLCHDHAVRLEIRAVAPGTMRLAFSRRRREGDMVTGHPTIETHVGNLRAHIGLQDFHAVAEALPAMVGV